MFQKLILSSLLLCSCVALPQGSFLLQSVQCAELSIPQERIEKADACIKECIKELEACKDLGLEGEELEWEVVEILSALLDKLYEVFDMTLFKTDSEQQASIEQQAYIQEFLNSYYTVFENVYLKLGITVSPMVCPFGGNE
jgi:hypothetical protein